MSAFENAKKFFVACEGNEGWAGCSPYVVEGAAFNSQCEPLLETKTVQEYSDWVAGLNKGPLPGSRYELHASAYDEATRKAIFSATFHAKHTADGGPVPPTNKETHTDYVYVVTMNSEDKVESMTKIWNAPWALKELGWM